MWVRVLNPERKTPAEAAQTRSQRADRWLGNAPAVRVKKTGVASFFVTPANFVHSADAQADIEELWQRMACFVLITNVDDHLHNHGFLHANRGQWRLAPAFDVNPFPDRVRDLKTWISEDTGPEATIEALLSVLPYFRISRGRANEILRRLERAISQWRKTGLALGMTNHELDQFADAFEHPEREAARQAAL